MLTNRHCPTRCHDYNQTHRLCCCGLLLSLQAPRLEYRVHLLRPVHSSAMLTLLNAMLLMSFCVSCAPLSTWLGRLTYVQPCFSTI